MRIIFSIKPIIVFSFVLLISGCVIVENVSDNIAGTYVKTLERNKENGASKVVNYSIGESFERVVHILDKMGVEIMKVNSKDYSIFAVASGGKLIEDSIDSTFQANTADVGIFFVEEEKNKTKIYISCFSSLVLERTADEVFSQL